MRFSYKKALLPSLEFSPYAGYFVMRSGLVKETRRGKWRFYDLRKEAVGRALAILGEHLNVA